jgi:hypothetical protein
MEEKKLKIIFFKKSFEVLLRNLPIYPTLKEPKAETYKIEEKK